MTITKYGDSGLEVRKVQLLLNSNLKPNPKLTVDGNFGLQTSTAVKAFQKQAGLDVDGEVGPATRLALSIKPTPTPVPAVVVGSSSNWMDIAVAELGIREDSLPGKHNARIVEYHGTTTLKATADETPWCSSFVNWVLIQSGRRGTNSAAAKSWLQWGRQSEEPSLGDIVVIQKKTPGVTQATGSPSGFHVGFLVSKTSASIRILGGNQSDSVKYSNFGLNSYAIKGFRRP